MKKLYFRIFAVIMALTMMVMCMTGCMPADTYALDDEPATATEPIETETKTIETEAPTVAPILETEAPATEPPADHVHSYTETVIAPTCVKEGYTRYACDCGYAYNGAITEIVDHNMIETERLDSTCVYDGYYIMSCTECDYEERYELEAHNFVLHAESCTPETAANSCIGSVVAWECTECGEYKDEFIKGKDHNYKHANEYPPCGTDAYYDYECTNCGQIVRKPTDAEFAEHNFIDDDSLEPGFRICSHCGRVKYSSEWE